MDEQVVRLRIRLCGLRPVTFGTCEGIEVGIQQGTEVLAGEPQPDGSIAFVFDVRVRRDLRTGS